MEQDNKTQTYNFLEKQLEALLFWKGEPVSIKKLSQILEKGEEEIISSLKNLETSLSNRGIVLMFKDDEVTLGTSPEVSELIEKVTKDELVRDLGRAGLETLSIIIYQGPISRAEIDYIRGVQSNFILRNLMIRGLVEKIPNPKDQRSFLYKPTFDMLGFMGITKIEEMPNYNEVRLEIESYRKAQLENKNDEVVVGDMNKKEVLDNKTDTVEDIKSAIQ